MLLIASLSCGLVFGAGLLISGMVQPAKVLGFLDIFGAWDPSLAVVMIGALAVSIPGFMQAKRRARPLLTAESFWPSKHGLDRPLVIGSALFGIGWGLAGLCPGDNGPQTIRCGPAETEGSMVSPHSEAERF